MALTNLGPNEAGVQLVLAPSLLLHRPLSNKKARELIRGDRIIGSWKERNLREL